MEDVYYRIRSRIRKSLFGELPLIRWDELLAKSSERERLFEESKSDFARVFFKHEGRTAHK
jgi:hypothetical protein